MKITRSSLKRTFSFSWRDLLVSAAILLCATGACALLHQTADTIDGFASPVYVLAVLLISRFTSGYLFGLIAAGWVSSASTMCLHIPIWRLTSPFPAIR